MPDREKLIRALECQMNFDIGCTDADCPYRIGYVCSQVAIIRDVLEFMKTQGPAWISVTDQLPEQKESLFSKYYGTDTWSNAMWQMDSEKVIVAVSFKDGSSRVTTGCLRDGKWKTDISHVLEPIVTHWIPFPPGPKEVNVDA